MTTIKKLEETLITLALLLVATFVVGCRYVAISEDGVVTSFDHWFDEVNDQRHFRCLGDVESGMLSATIVNMSEEMMLLNRTCDGYRYCLQYIDQAGRISYFESPFVSEVKQTHLEVLCGRKLDEGDTFGVDASTTIWISLPLKCKKLLRAAIEIPFVSMNDMHACRTYQDWLHCFAINAECINVEF